MRRSWQARRRTNQLPLPPFGRPRSRGGGRGRGERLAPFHPATDSPEGKPEEDCSASVDSEGITQLISSTRVVLGVNIHVAPEKKIRQGAGHQGAMQHPQAKSSGAAAVHRFHRPVDAPAQAGRQQTNGPEPEECAGPCSAGWRRFGLSRDHSFRRAKACF